MPGCSNRTFKKVDQTGVDCVSRGNNDVRQAFETAAPCWRQILRVGRPEIGAFEATGRLAESGHDYLSVGTQWSQRTGW